MMMMHARAAFSIMTQKAPPTRLLHLNASIHAAARSLLCISMERWREEFLFFALPLARCYRAAAALSFSAVCCCSSLPRPKTRIRTHDDACMLHVKQCNCATVHTSGEPVRTTYKGAIAIANIGATSCLSALQFAILKNRLYGQSDM